MKVKEIMTRDLTAVEPGITVKELILLFERSGLTSVPVVDEEGRILGIVSERDIIEGAMPGYFELLYGTAFFADMNRFSQKLREIENDRIEFYMTSDAIKIEEDEDDLTAADLLIRKNLKALPVVNRDGILVGMLRRIDLLKDLL
ncbi:CBS domain-containing protein [Candidatus Acetothermia bacterium]|nr:CBS domain-containing protein [Candidatus Acetothermia bacterium]MCI2431866.1 CBS domain-containing protein [Candidatus Acetothermia bacterium]MCI2435967.1 CBS domain-containing protein [Candidatus Acetothermia bacterium]